MSVMRYSEMKVVLPRTGADEFWKLIHDHYAGDDSRKWKYLAMLALRENAGWTLEDIGRVFNHPKGHVTRCLEAVKSEIRERFRVSPELLELDPALDPTLPDDRDRRREDPVWPV